MGALSARDLLLVWERAERRRPAERAQMLFAAACPELEDDALAAVPLGRREACLFRLYQETFGTGLDLATPCPHCGETLEISIGIDALGLGLDDGASAEAVEIEDGPLRLCLRPLGGGDLAAAAGCADVEAARRLLAGRAVLEATRDGEGVDPFDLTDAEVELISRALAALDPQAEILLDLDCPGCGHAWQALLDAADCLWHEIDAAARRLLREVHLLARSYGWREADILAMSAVRRRRYLEILAG
ncbi:MAG TPA: phage baseplate protein [Acidobacteria bacterium]|nr:phage baseplate protein [Acidobacteriota bacterium]